jgi:DNA-binding transcriptional regulator YhcF (GntR family)
MLPSVRQLGRELGVNQNTILKIYDRLAAEGLLEMRHGEGTFVAERRRRAGLAGEVDAHRERLVDELTQIVRQARMLGFSRRDMKQLFEQAVDIVESQMPSREAKS